MRGLNPEKIIREVLVLGGGSAGLIAAVTLKRKIPDLKVTLLRSQELGTIGVGEGTTPNFVEHVFGYLGIDPKTFHEIADPTWKLGLRLLWGRRTHFDYSFAPNLDAQWSDLPMPNGYYLEKEFDSGNEAGALMSAGKAFGRRPDGSPEVQPWYAFHVENAKLIRLFDLLATDLGVETIEARITGAERGDAGITAVMTDDGRRFQADLFVDASGFRAELIGKVLNEPYVDFGNSLFCDRAVVGGWERDGEPILPYTTAETMDAGWCWRIDHEHFINRGYVFSSRMVGDDEARAEFKKRNPKVGGDLRVVGFRSGYRKRNWVGNVVAIGNAAGFVEPLEATALMLVCSAARDLTNLLLQVNRAPGETVRNLYNRRTDAGWRDIRDFLALHYRLNDRIDTPFWRMCREETDVSGVADLLRFYAENGPNGFGRHLLPNTINDFGIEGYLVMLLGNGVEHRNPYRVTPEHRSVWEGHRRKLRRKAKLGMDVKEALAWFRRNGWRGVRG